MGGLFPLRPMGRLVGWCDKSSKDPGPGEIALVRGFEVTKIPGDLEGSQRGIRNFLSLLDLAPFLVLSY